jgi:hypothetical protein
MDFFFSQGTMQMLGLDVSNATSNCTNLSLQTQIQAPYFGGILRQGVMNLEGDAVELFQASGQRKIAFYINVNALTI